MKATKIKMRDGRLISYNPLDIDGIYLDGAFYKVEDIYDRLKKIENEKSEEKIYLADSNKYLIPVIALNGKRYVRSYPNTEFVDGLLKLPRE